MDDTAKTSAILETDSNLRSLLETVFDSSDSYVFEDVLFRFKECVSFDLSCLFYLKEKRWFTDSPTQQSDDYLKFAYLAFELKDGVISRFPGRRQLIQREAQLIESGYTKDDTNLCTIIYQSSHAPRDLRRIINLIKRIFVAFYKNCGAHDHFVESVSRRFIREFYAQQQVNRNLSAVTNYIHRKCELDVSVWNQKDEMYFHQEASVADLLAYGASSGIDHKTLFEDKQFQLDLKTSVTRKNQTYGKAIAQDTYYVIRTFSDSYFIGETGHSNFKTQQKAVAIYSRKSRPISIDAVWHANRLIDTYLRTTQEIQYHSIILDGTHKCALLEEELSTVPVNTKDSLADEFKKLLNPLLSEVANHTRAELACMRLYEPFTDSLIPIASGFSSETSCEDELKPISLKADSTSISARSFLSDTIIDEWHPNKLRQDLTEATRDGLENRVIELEQALSLRMHSRDNIGRLESAAVALPIRKGNFLIGVVEFGSAEVSRLSYEARFFELVASICGDIIRRIELANDRGWLARMSFIHAARHRIEAILRDLRAKNDVIAKELVELIQTGNVPKSAPIPRQTKFAAASSEIAKLLIGHGSESDGLRVLAELQSIDDVCGISDRACELIVDIFETLIANSSHSDFSAADISVALRENGTSSSFICIQYAPAGVTVQIERMEQLCIAPIPDQMTHTFHYGIFLLSSQVRMVGGIATARPISDDALGGTPFGVSFLIPLVGE